MDIAVQLEKYDLGNDRYLFKPVSVMRGKYNSEEDLFESEYGIICAPMNGSRIYTDTFFHALTSLEELKSKYGNDYSEKDLISFYFDNFIDKCYLGCLDPIDCVINSLEVDFTDVEARFMQANNDDTGVKFAFESGVLEDLKELNTIEEVKARIDELLSYSKKAKQEMSTKLIGSPSENKGKESVEEVQEGELSLKKEESKLLTLKELRKEVNDIIINQEKAVNAITRTIIINQKSKNHNHKQHMLVAGPSGTGKTKIIDIIAKKLDLPYFIADATAYTKSGYVGKDVYSMLEGLINAAGGDIKKAQNGILIIDEIDKKLSGRTDDVGGVDVIYSLLKIMDRGVIEVDIGPDYMKKKVLFDTSNLNIICMGAFEGLYKQKTKENKNVIGFGTQIEEQSQKLEITRQDMIDYGVPAEFLGRIGIVTYTEKLSVEDLVEILYKSKESPLEETKEFFKDEGVDIIFTDEFIREKAIQASKTNTGARNLRSVVKESLEYAYDMVLNDEKVKTLRLTKETAINSKKFDVL